MFIYSTSPPEIELCIDRFRIYPNALTKGDAPKPKLRKDPALKPLVTQAYQKVQRTQRYTESHDGMDTVLHDSFASQSILSHDLPEGSASQSFYSQAPPHNLQSTPKGHTAKNRASLGNSAELLAFYSNRKPIQNTLATKETSHASESSLREGDRQQHPWKANMAPAAPKESNSPHLEQCAEERHLHQQKEESSNNAGATCAHTSHDVDMLTEYANQTENSANSAVTTGLDHTVKMGDIEEISKKRRRDSTATQSQQLFDANLRPNTSHTTKPPSPSRKRQRTDAEEDLPVNPVGIEQLPPKNVLSTLNMVAGGEPAPVDTSIINHWEGMTKIPLSEIEISKEQTALLGQRQWVPQHFGEPAPLCHVPPRLLSRWNDIAQRRQRSAERPEHTSDRPSSPASQDTSPSNAGDEFQLDSDGEEPYPWPPSPGRVPRDTPPKHSTPRKESPTMTGAQVSTTLHKYNEDVDMETETRTSPLLNVVGSQNVSNITVNSPSRLLQTLPVTSNFECSGHVTGSNPSLKLGASRPLDVESEGEPSSLINWSPRHPSNSHEITSAFESRVEQGIDGSDDESHSEMETTLPSALGGSVPLSSHPQHEPTSSGPPLPEAMQTGIQVVETPSINNRTRLQDNELSSYETPISQQPLFNDANSSSFSRIRNTYCSQDSHRENDLSQKETDPSLAPPDNESPHVGTFGSQTQTSSVHALSQTVLQSPSDAALDSSNPARRQRGSSIFHLPDDMSSLPCPSSHPPAMSHSNETSHVTSQDSTKSQYNLDGASQLPEPSSKAPSVISHSENNTHDAPHGPNVEIVTRRQGFLGKDDMSAQAQTIYEKFRNAYPSYPGDFSHFVEMCSRLHTMRKQGLLRRSFLWDDFIILNMEEYTRYFEQHASQDSTILNYEEYFCSNFSRPRYKKRSLNTNGIEIVASQYVRPPGSESPSIPPPIATYGEPTESQPMQSEGANVSFTASLAEKFSALHARSFGYTNIDHDPGPLMPTAIDTSPMPSDSSDLNVTQIKQEAEISNQSTAVQAFIGDSLSSIEQKPVIADLDTEMDDPPTQSSTEAVHPVAHQSNFDITAADVPEIEETQEVDDPYHETASIELGDDINDRRVSVSPDLNPAAASEDNSVTEPPRQRRPWFRSLQNIWQPRPGWFNDPNTPFKRWARQDQNVLQEINRRGGTKVLFDEKGLIRRPTQDQRAKGP